MKKWFLVLIVPCLLLACKDRKKHLTDNDVVDIKDFIGFFTETKLPFQVADSTLQRDEDDSSSISFKVLSQFVPDTLIGRHFGHRVKPSIYPVAKVSVKNEETYLFIKAVTDSKQAIFILAFDKDKKFAAGMPLLVANEGNPTHTTAVLDTKYTLTTLVQHKKSDGVSIYRKSAYVYNSAGAFTLILTESNDVAAVKSILINPIDTLPAKHRLSGDYVQDKMNIVSIRDGRNNSQLYIFIHFEKEGGTCKGELKGYARMVSSAKAVYHEQGDPCTLELIFSGNKVSLHEEGCGSHRDIKCFFEGSYTRKKLPPRPAKKETRAKRKQG